MESKKEQIVRFFASVSRAVQILWPWLLDIGIVVFVAASLVSLMGCRCTAAAYGTQRTTKDSTVVRYRTVTRDSVRTRDSVVVSYNVRTRDSVVLRVDASTGEVVGRDTWHWRDNEASREHFGDTQRTASKEDSLSSASVRTDSIRVPVPVERKLSKWERICRPVKDMLSILGAIAMAVVITWIVVEVRDWARGKI